MVCNSVWQNSFTGIQRVQLEVATRLCSANVARPFSLFNGSWHDLRGEILGCKGDPDVLIRSFRLKHAATVKSKLQFADGYFLPIALRVLRRVMRLFSDRMMVKQALKNINQGDVLLAMGAFWQVPGVLDVYIRLGSRGVHLVGMCHDIFSILRRHGPCASAAAKHMKKFLAIMTTLLVVSAYTRAELRRAVALRLVKVRCGDPIVVPLVQQFPGVERNAAIALTDSLNGAIGRRPYVLLVSSYEPRKNHLLAFDVWRRLAAQTSVIPPVLVCAGKRGELASDLLPEHALWIDRPSDEDMRALYSNCLFSVMPSLEEGWGLPVGEALWFGKVCLSSNSTSLPEVGDGLSITFDPCDADAMLKHVTELLDEETRGALERNITASELRTWDDVGRDISNILVALGTHRP